MKVKRSLFCIGFFVRFSLAQEDADHPMAKMVLRIVRESAAVDDSLEASKSRRQKRMEKEAIQVQKTRLFCVA